MLVSGLFVGVGAGVLVIVHVRVLKGYGILGLVSG
jgi:hypothetical protein